MSKLAEVWLNRNYDQMRTLHPGSNKSSCCEGELRNTINVNNILYEIEFIFFTFLMIYLNQPEYGCACGREWDLLLILQVWHRSLQVLSVDALLHFCVWAIKISKQYLVSQYSHLVFWQWQRQELQPRWRQEPAEELRSSLSWNTAWSPKTIHPGNYQKMEVRWSLIYQSLFWY